MINKVAINFLRAVTYPMGGFRGAALYPLPFVFQIMEL